MALPRSPWRRWRCALLVPTAASGTSHPRARFGCALLVPKVALACPIGRGSRSVVVARPRPSASRLVRTTPRGRGRRGRRSRPKPSAAVRCQTSLPRICRARFSASGGRRPRSGEVWTLPRTANRETGVVCASRGLRFASAILAATGTQRGRCGDTSRGPRESVARPLGRVGTMTVARVDDGRGAVGC